MSIRTAHWLALLAALAASAATCGGHHGSPSEADELVYSCEDAPTGQPFASDESWTKFIEAKAAGKLTADDCRAPALTSPSAGTVLDRTTPPLISFMPTQAACGTQAAAPAGSRRSCGRRAGRGGWDRVWQFMSPIGVAEAHCPAVEGTNYLLRIADASDTIVYSALLSVTSFTPKADIWSKAMSGRGGQTLRLTIQRAAFGRGNIVEGPFEQKQPFSFTVAP